MLFVCSREAMTGCSRCEDEWFLLNMSGFNCYCFIWSVENRHHNDCKLMSMQTF